MCAFAQGCAMSFSLCNLPFLFFFFPRGLFFTLLIISPSALFPQLLVSVSLFVSCMQILQKNIWEVPVTHGSPGVRRWFPVIW